MSTLSEAIRHYRDGDYRTALTLFQEAEAIYGTHIVRFNIELCERHLAGRGQTKTTPARAPRHSVTSVFDQIYLVNLERHVKRRLSAAAQLRHCGIPFTLFDAVNGYVGEVYERYLAYAAAPLGGLKRYPQFSQREITRGKKFIESAGAFGYIETYLAILRDARKRELKRILIVEDDVILHPEFHKRFSDFIDRIPADWKLLQLGASQYHWQSVNEPAALAKGYYTPRVLDTCGSFAIGIDASIYDELIEAQSAFEGPFDHLPLGEIYERHPSSCHVAYPNLVMPDVSDSSIRHQRDQYSHSQKMRWRMDEFVYPLPPPSIAIQVTSATNLRYLDRFGQDATQPYHLRLFSSGKDGVRPVHTPAHFELPANERIDSSPIAQLPAADSYARLSADKTLTERDILNFLENQLLGRDLPTSLEPLSCQAERIVAGRVSVILPTYERPRNLSIALESVAAQDYPDVQIVVVSDNPPDSEAAAETRALVEDFRASHPGLNLHFIQHQHNRNGAAARNTGILQSDGEFICFLDDDDAYLPGRIALSVSALRQEPGHVGAVYCGFLGWNSPVDDPQRYQTGDLTSELLLLEYKKHYLHTNTATYRRSALLHINGFDETYRRHQDIELNLRFFEHYTVGAVQHAGVQLNPEPSGTVNKLFNSNFLGLKQKFLDRFHTTIEALGPEAAHAVYQRHWEEVVRYVKDRGEIDTYLSQIRTNGPLQIALLLDKKSRQTT